MKKGPNDEKPKRVEKQSSTASEQSSRQLIDILQQDDQDLAEAKIRAAAQSSPSQQQPQERLQVASLPAQDTHTHTITRNQKARRIRGGDDSADDAATATAVKPSGNTTETNNSTTISDSTTNEDEDAKEKAKALASNPTQQYANRSQAVAVNMALRASEQDAIEDINNLQEVSTELDVHREEQTPSNASPSIQTENRPGAYRMETSLAAPSAETTTSISEESSEWSDEENHDSGAAPEGLAPLSSEPSPDEALVHDTGEILVEATLVESTARKSNPAPIIPEPALVTAERMPEGQSHRYDPKQMIKHRYGRLWIFAFVAVFFSSLLSLGITLGVILGKGPDNPPDIQAPTSAAPTSFLEDVLPEATRIAVQTTNGTAQALAYAWYQQDQDYIMQMNVSLTRSYNPLQRFALATFYFATDGNNWINHEKWLDHNHTECDWASKYRGSICAGAAWNRKLRSRRLQATDTRPYYTVLSLHQNNVTGSLPPEIALLSNLDIINIYGNQITGTIPTELGNLKRLTVFQSIQNEMVGPIPSELGMMQKLRELIVSTNLHSGTIPSELGLASSLEKVSVSMNNLNGTIPTQMGNLTGLRGIYTYGNKALAGPLPTELGLLTLLTHLQMLSCNHTNQLPSELGMLTNLEYIDIADNSLSGTIPNELGLSTSMQTISLARNRLEGTIPTVFGKLSNLEILSLYGNLALSGPLPSELGLLRSLKSLQMNSANVNYQLPSEIGLVQSLEEIRLSDNWNLPGSIPESWVNLTNLMRLSLHNTNLTGTVPVGLCDLLQDTELEISVDCDKIFCNCSCDCSRSTDKLYESEMTYAPTQNDDGDPDIVGVPVLHNCSEVPTNFTNGNLTGCEPERARENHQNYSLGDSQPQLVTYSAPVSPDDSTADEGREVVVELPPPPPPSETSPEFFDENDLQKQALHETSSANIFDHS